MQVHQQGRQIFPNQWSSVNRQSSNIGALMRSIANLSSHILSKFSSSGIVLLTANITLIIFGLVYLYKKSTQYNAALKSSAAAEKLAIEAANKNNSTLQEEIIRLKAQNIPSVVSNSRIKLQITPLNSPSVVYIPKKVKLQITPLNSPSVVYIPKKEAETLLRNLPSLISSGEEKKEEESIGKDLSIIHKMKGFFKAKDVFKKLDKLLNRVIKKKVSFNKKWMTYYVLACTWKLPNLKKYCEDILVKTLEESAEKVREEDFDILPFDLTNVYYKTDLSTISRSLTSLIIHITHPVALEGIERAMKKADVPDEDLEAFWEAKLQLIKRNNLKKKDDETAKEYCMRFLMRHDKYSQKLEIIGHYIRYIKNPDIPVYNFCSLYSLKENYKDYLRWHKCRNWSNLHTLKLEGKDELNMDREKIASWIRCMPKLRHFSIMGIFVTEEEAFNLVSGFKSLETIKMSYKKSKTVDLTSFVKMLCQNHSNIRHLNLHGFPLSEKDVIYIALHCPLLEILDLFNAPMITNKALKAIGIHCKQLTQIGLNTNGAYKYPRSDLTTNTILSFVDSCSNLSKMKIPFHALTVQDQELFESKTYAIFRCNQWQFIAKYNSCDIKGDNYPLNPWIT